MKVNLNMLLSSNPFIGAYVQADWLGKIIFIGLIALSVCSWIIILHKVFLTYRAKRNSILFQSAFQLQKSNPLALESDSSLNKRYPNPFYDLYMTLKRNALEILNKNRRFGKQENTSYLSPVDIDFLDAHLVSSVAAQTKNLEKNLFILSTVVSLGPFMGLLGTVWGILTTFTELQMQTGGTNSQMVMGGLALALATTVMGLLAAIPALIGYNYLKNTIGAFETEMQGFSTDILAAVEMQYRKVDLR